MKEVEEELPVLSQLLCIEIGRIEKRPLCYRCRLGDQQPTVVNNTHLGRRNGGGEWRAGDG
ncbi:hypothetical protein E2C01_010947 [Portunus trituberculatus]|uniref:Uncharacterized protein n=1 Tax=Portunus trituberculatus TaxID=210409 RepID=A0A5B7DA82_PORTR|nr:hypothetical protein [Portunus trituberculatus]